MLKNVDGNGDIETLSSVYTFVHDVDLFSSQINPGAGVCEQSCNWKSGPAWNGRRGLIRMKSKKSRATMAL